MDKLSTKNYAFILGREKDLALAELKAVLARFGFCFSDLIVSDKVVFINFDKMPFSVANLIEFLGGSVKIFKILKYDVNTTNNLKEILKDEIKDSKLEAKFNYGISSYSKKYNQRFVNNLGLSIKKELKNKLSLRYVALQEEGELSTIQSLKNRLDGEGIEFGLFNEEVGVLIGLNNPEAWSKRDYDKPASDKRSGMLPPKLARMMANLAISQASRVERKAPNPQNANRLTLNCLVVDPFCGSGNVLMEALMVGCDVFGSDISEKAVRDSEANVQWLLKNFPITFDQLSINLQIPNFKIIQADAKDAKLTQLIENWQLKIENYDCLAIVSEPYLGEPKKFKPTMNAVRGEYEKVKELYLRFFNNIKRLAKSDKRTVLCVVFPLVETLEGKRYSLFEDSVDEITKIGYSVLVKPLSYGRDYQVVKREIALLSLNR